jgi:hypothetical protein
MSFSHPDHHAADVPMVRGSRVGWLVSFLVALGAFGLLCQQMLANGYVGAETSRAAVALSGSAGAALSEVYPLFPYFLARGLALLPVIGDDALYYADVLAAAVLIGLGYGRLRASGAGVAMAAGLMLLVAANPIFLYAATGGSGLALAVFFAYLGARGMLMAAGEMPWRGIAVAVLALTGVLLSSPLGLYFALMAVPFLLLASRQDFLSGDLSPAYFWTFAAIPLGVLALLVGVHFALSGSRADLMGSLAGAPQLGSAAGRPPWPYLMGASPGAVAGVVFAGLIIAFPALALGLTGVFSGLGLLRALLLFLGIAIVTGIVTTSLGVLSHPAYLWAFAVAPTLVVLERVRSGAGGRALAVVALLAGIGGGWWLMGLYPTLNLTLWRTELSAALTSLPDFSGGPAEAAEVAPNEWDRE